MNPNIPNPLLEAIHHLLKVKKNPLIAIDGGSATGKSTLSQALNNIYDCNIIHTDHFFLPPSLRTKERFAKAGENIHHERMNSQVFDKLLLNQTFSYDIFDCSIMDYRGTETIISDRLTIIEGVYCLRPDFQKLYDLKIFLEADFSIRCDRILQRNGTDQFSRFLEEWIPMEDHYFNTFQIKNICDFCI